MTVTELSIRLKHCPLRTIICIACLVISFLCGALICHAKQPLDDLFGVSLPDDEQAWVCGRWGAIFHASDGGETWQRQESTTDQTLSAIFFWNTKTGWAVGDEGTILHTTDGGTTWVKQKSPVPYFLLDVHFATARKGWIVSERTTILFTQDGGSTWEVQFEDKDFILKAVSFCDDLNGWAVGEYGFIYHTTDGGITWEHQAGQFGWSEETGEIVGGTYLFDVAAIDSQTAWAVGMDGYVTRTVDGGKTWERVQSTFPTTHLLGIAADKKGGLVICGEGLLMVSADGGKGFTRRQHDPVIMYGWLNGATAAPGGRLVTVGKEGWVYATSDYGNSWNRVSTK